MDTENTERSQKKPRGDWHWWWLRVAKPRSEPKRYESEPPGAERRDHEEVESMAPNFVLGLEPQTDVIEQLGHAVFRWREPRR